MRLFLLIVLAFFGLAACNDDKPNLTTAQLTENVEEQEQSQNEEVVYFSWLEGLNVRARPDLSAKVVAKINPADTLVKTGRRSPEKSVVVLRGLAYSDHWYEVKLPEQKTAWVFGGAIKTRDEVKGHAPISDLKFNFPGFGAFNLHNWKRVAEDHSKNGDTQHHIKTYRHPSAKQKLVITKTDKGEFGYAVDYDLLGVDNEPILSRALRFDNDTKILTEEVITHNIYPKRKVTRTQNIGVSYLELNDKPMMAQGEWTREVVEQ